MKEKTQLGLFSTSIVTYCVVVFYCVVVLLRKQRNTIRFGTIRLKWKTGVKVHHENNSVKALQKVVGFSILWTQRTKGILTDYMIMLANAQRNSSSSAQRPGVNFCNT